MPIENLWRESRKPKSSCPAQGQHSISLDTHIAQLTEQMGAVKQSLVTLEGADTRLVAAVGEASATLESLKIESQRIKEVLDALEEKLGGVDNRVAAMEQQHVAERAEMRGRMTVIKIVLGACSMLGAFIGWVVGNFLRPPL